MTPFCTDQYFLCPTQPSRLRPLKSLIVSDLPFLGGTSGASAARATDAARAIATNDKRVRNIIRAFRQIMALLLGEKLVRRAIVAPCGERRKFCRDSVRRIAK